MSAEIDKQHHESSECDWEAALRAQIERTIQTRKGEQLTNYPKFSVCAQCLVKTAKDLASASLELSGIAHSFLSKQTN